MLSVDINPKRVTPDSMVFADRKIVILETIPESLLSDIFAIDTYKDNIYVLDELRTTIFVFDGAGKYVRRIGRQGRGPGEYGQIISFCIDRHNNEILITTDRPSKILYYSPLGEFLGETETEDLLFEVVKIDGDLNARLLDEKYDFAMFEMNGHSIKSVKFPRMPKLSMDRQRLISPFGSNLLGSVHGVLFTRTFDNTIYKVEGNDELVPLMTLDFGKYWQKNANLLDLEEVNRQAFANRSIYEITNARLMGQDKVIFNGFPNGVFVVDKNKVTQYGSITNELSISPLGKKDMTPILDPETDYVAFSYKALEFLHLSAKEDRSGYTDDMIRLADVKEDDNPVIFLYKLRDDLSN